MAAKFFSITAKDPGILTDGLGEVTLTVTNVSGHPIRGQVWLSALGETQKDWLSIDGETEKDFGIDETHSFTVKIRAPASTPEGTYTFRPVVASFQRPNEEFDEGQMIAFQVPKVEEPVGFNWWPVIAVIAGLVLVGGAVAVWMMRSGSTVMVPEVVGMPGPEAMQAITDAGLNPLERDREITASAANAPAGVSFPPPPGTVLRVEPEQGAEVEQGSTVELTLEANARVVPKLSGNTLEQAVGALQRRGLKLGKLGTTGTTKDALVGKVDKQDPIPDKRVLDGTEVNLWLYHKRGIKWDKVLSNSEIRILQSQKTAILDSGLQGFIRAKHLPPPSESPDNR